MIKNLLTSYLLVVPVLCGLGSLPQCPPLFQFDWIVPGGVSIPPLPWQGVVRASYSCFLQVWFRMENHLWLIWYWLCCSKLYYRHECVRVKRPMPLSSFMGLVESFSSYQTLVREDLQKATALSQDISHRYMANCTIHTVKCTYVCTSHIWQCSVKSISSRLGEFI